MKRSPLLLFVFLLCAAPTAQGKDVFHDSLSLWRPSSAALRLAAEPVTDGGTVYAGGRYLSGEARRMQESASEGGLHLRAEDRRNIGRLRTAGTFTFRQDWLAGRLWTDNFTPFDGNPYKVASDIPGRYSRQIFAFSAGVASWLKGDRMALALGGDYRVGDLSRSNDPRSRSQRMDLSLRPALLFRLSGPHLLGLELEYDYSREKMLKLASKAENIDRYTYYELTGNADYTPVGIIGFSRRYARHAGGGQLHYGYEGGRWRCLLWGGYAYGVTGILGETGESPGDYRSGRLQAGAALSLRAQLLHQWTFRYVRESGTADTFIQEQRIVTNAQGRVDSYWETLLRYPSFQYLHQQFSLQWTCRPLMDDGWWSGIRAGWENSSSACLQPVSVFAWSRLRTELLGGGRFPFGKGHSLELSGSLGGLWAVGVDHQENASLSRQGKTRLLKEVFRPDAVFLSRHALTASLRAEYVFPISKTLLGLAFDTVHLHTFSPGGSRMGFTLGAVLYY